MLSSASAISTPSGQLAILRMAAEDDSFRSQLRQNPVEILASHGLSVDPESVPATVKLPAKEEIRAALASTEAEAPIIKTMWAGIIGS